MKQKVIIFILTFISVTAFGQKRKLPPKDTYYPISKMVCEFPRQTGKLEITKNDSLKMTSYKTDSSEMIMYADHFIGFLTGWDKKEEAQKIYLHLDSLVTLLFQNGLMTSDLFVQAFNIESKYIDYKGDTVDWTNQVEAKTVKLLNIQRKELPKKYKDKKGTILFEVWVTFNPYESGWGSFPMFDLYLKSDIEPTTSNLTEYLKKAKIKCLRYTGTQI